jgi:tetratricopeptide (TPR) repeat protein
VADLEEAIGLYEEALSLRPEGHEHRAESLNDLGDAFFHYCFQHEADKTRSQRCIELLREALHLRPPGHPLRDKSLHNLARSLHFVLYQQLSSLEIIMESVSLNREALQLRPSGHPERANSLNNLAGNLRNVVRHTGDVEMQAEVVNMNREVVSIWAPGHPMHHISLINLGLALCSSFKHCGGSDILAEAISVTREAMQLHHIGHPSRFAVLESLGAALSLRSVYEGNLDSLPEAVDLIREALQLLPNGHPERARIMANLAESLLASFRNSRDGSVLAEAISLLRESITLQPPGASEHDMIFNELAEALEAKYDIDSNTKTLFDAANLHRSALHLRPNGPQGDLKPLSEALRLHREVLHLRPIGNLRRFESLEGLARVLCKFGCESWPEALSCYQEAVQVCPVGYPARARLLSGMSKCFLDSSSPFFDLSAGISCLSEAYAHPFTHISGRLKSAGPDLQQLEAAYVASTRGTQNSPHSRDKARVLDLYSQVIDLLPLAANFGLDHSTRLQALTGSDGIARNAAARAVLLDCLPQAVEMLEQGRGVFWTQTLHLHANAFDGVPEDDRQELQRMLRILEHGARRVERLEQSATQHERELETRRRLNDAVQVLIRKIRGHPGLDRFLLPPAFGALFCSLPEGLVVIVNASKLGHHALLLRHATGLATSLALRPFPTGFDFATLHAQIPRDVVPSSQHHNVIGTRAMRLNKGRAGEFEDVLSLLWSSITQPIVDALGLHVSGGLVSHTTCLIASFPASTRSCSSTTLVVRDRRAQFPAYSRRWEV